MTAAFALHERLAADCIRIGDLPLCHVLLMNDSRFPWCILVPRRAGLRELHDLAQTDGHALIDELNRVSHALLEITGADKLNVAALGNLVPQLHLHIVARQPHDSAWPGPVWGSGAAQPYAAGAGTRLAARLGGALDLPDLPEDSP